MVFGLNGQSGTNQDLVKIASGVAIAANAAFDLNFEIGEIELRDSRHLVERRGEASCQGAEQQLLRSPTALQASQLGGLREVDGVGRGLALGQSSAA